jgi:hypothetical protein
MGRSDGLEPTDSRSTIWALDHFGIDRHGSRGRGRTCDRSLNKRLPYRLATLERASLVKRAQKNRPRLSLGGWNTRVRVAALCEAALVSFAAEYERIAIRARASGLRTYQRARCGDQFLEMELHESDSVLGSLSARARAEWLMRSCRFVLPESLCEAHATTNSRVFATESRPVTAPRR